MRTCPGSSAPLRSIERAVPSFVGDQTRHCGGLSETRPASDGIQEGVAHDSRPRGVARTNSPRKPIRHGPHDNSSWVRPSAAPALFHVCHLALAHAELLDALPDSGLRTSITRVSNRFAGCHRWCEITLGWTPWELEAFAPHRFDSGCQGERSRGTDAEAIRESVSSTPQGHVG